MSDMSNPNAEPNGLCLVCAKELGIKPVDDMLKRMNISDEDIEEALLLGILGKVVLALHVGEAVEAYLVEHPVEAPVQSVNGKTGAVVLDAEDVGALPADTPIPVVPTNVSAFNNDAGYLTQYQDVSGKEDKVDIVVASGSTLAAAVGKYYILMGCLKHNFGWLTIF